jgi:hypothetical protein
LVAGELKNIISSDCRNDSRWGVDPPNSIQVSVRNENVPGQIEMNILRKTHVSARGWLPIASKGKPISCNGADGEGNGINSPNVIAKLLGHKKPTLTIERQEFGRLDGSGSCRSAISRRIKDAIAGECGNCTGTGINSADPEIEWVCDEKIAGGVDCQAVWSYAGTGGRTAVSAKRGRAIASHGSNRPSHSINAAHSLVVCV